MGGRCLPSRKRFAAKRSSILSGKWQVKLFINSWKLFSQLFSMFWTWTLIQLHKYWKHHEPLIVSKASCQQNAFLPIPFENLSQHSQFSATRRWYRNPSSTLKLQKAVLLYLIIVIIHWLQVSWKAHAISGESSFLSTEAKSEVVIIPHDLSSFSGLIFTSSKCLLCAPTAFKIRITWRHM